MKHHEGFKDCFKKTRIFQNLLCVAPVSKQLGLKLHSESASGLGPGFAVPHSVAPAARAVHTAAPMQRRVSAVAMVVKLLIYQRHAEWLGDREHFFIAENAEPVLSTKVLEKEGEKRQFTCNCLVSSSVTCFIFLFLSPHLLLP